MEKGGERGGRRKEGVCGNISDMDEVGGRKIPSPER